MKNMGWSHDKFHFKAFPGAIAQNLRLHANVTKTLKDVQKPYFSKANAHKLGLLKKLPVATACSILGVYPRTTVGVQSRR